MATSKVDPRISELRARIAILIEGSHWGKTRFLSVIQKKFSRIIEGIDRSISDSPENKQAALAVLENKKLVYIPLYHRNGLSISDWQRLLLSFKSIAPTRKVFSDESHVVSHLMSSSAEQSQNAYVELAVTEDQFLTSSITVSQSFFQSRPILLKPSSFEPNHIRRFVHMGQSYTWSHGVLQQIID